MLRSNFASFLDFFTLFQIFCHDCLTENFFVCNSSQSPQNSILRSFLQLQNLRRAFNVNTMCDIDRKVPILTVSCKHYLLCLIQVKKSHWKDFSCCQWYFPLNNFLFEINIGLFPETQIITESVESKRKTLEKFQFTTSKTVLAEQLRKSSI